MKISDRLASLFRRRPKKFNGQSPLKRGYVVGSGWWCDNSGRHAGSKTGHKTGADDIRTKDFFSLWYYFVDKYTDPEKIIIVDSASPVKPDLPKDERLEFLSLVKNWGHFVDCDYEKMCGVERAHLGCALYSYINDCNLVYIEQDCLVLGEGWLEKCFESIEKGKIMYGDGENTPQPIQQSLAIVMWEYIPTFVDRLIDQFYKHRDLLERGGDRSSHNTEHRWHDAFREDVDYVPFGYGRARPINFDDPHLYAQHWTDHELSQVLAREGLNHLVDTDNDQ